MIPNYLNDKAKTLFNNIATQSDRDWVWWVIESIKGRYPNADHWTTGGESYIDLRIGIRKKNRKGSPIFVFPRLLADKKPLFTLREYLQDEDNTQQIKSINQKTCNTEEAIKAWFDKCEQQISEIIASLQGSGLNPVDYVIDEPLLTGDEETEQKSSDLPSSLLPPLNQILFGPPGTGKTHATIDEALRILDPEFLKEHENDRTALKDRFDTLAATEDVRFVTFHQSFSYEDFVEGLRAVTNDDKRLEYLVEPGVFKRLCDDARTHGVQPDTGIRSNPRIWKISINGSGSSPTKSYCLNHGEARIGWGHTGDLKEPFTPNNYYQSLGSGNQGTLRYFSEEIVPGDILLCLDSAETIAAVGVVTGDYRYDDAVPKEVLSDYNHLLPVNWLYRDLKLPILPLNDDNQFVQKTVYSMNRFTWGDLLEYIEKSGAKPAIPDVVTNMRKPHVLIIDEINRGNISRIFGELITLIEPSKRAGATEALSVTLPYSKKHFSVPSNVYLIGTMNTADRSLAGLDIALRRRFTFKEMPPRPDLLDGINIGGVNIRELLRMMNERIEVLLDRDHCLGHAYFISLVNNDSIDNLAIIFRQQILPLLQEYFFEDWARIRWVLNDHRKLSVYQFIRAQDIKTNELFGDKVNIGNQQMVFSVNKEAFNYIQSYLGILDHQKAQKMNDAEALT